MLYLDANATSTLRPTARKAVEELLAGGLENANPSSIHAPGRSARALVREARKQIFRCLGLVDPKVARLIFTSGGTESCNTMIAGFLGSDLPSNLEIVVSTIEHQAVLEPIAELERRGAKVTRIGALRTGEVDVDSLNSAVSSSTDMLLIMAANNVSGVIQPVLGLARKVRSNGFNGILCCDASQALGKSSFDLEEFFDAGVDAIAISGHKVGAPTGTGALVLKASESLCRPFTPLILGGPQEERFRAGTENLLGIVGFGGACLELCEQGAAERRRLLELRERLWRGIKNRSEAAQRITPEEGTGVPSLCNTLAVSFPGLRGDDVVVALDLVGISCSTGSACSSGRQEPSYVFEAMGLEDEIVQGAIRFSLDWTATESSIDKASEAIGEALKRLYGVWRTDLSTSTENQL